ncbi:hypothetical protein ABPG72_007071 [Tetrahymena utriculariae]
MRETANEEKMTKEQNFLLLQLTYKKVNIEIDHASPAIALLKDKGSAQKHRDKQLKNLVLFKPEEEKKSHSYSHKYTSKNEDTTTTTTTQSVQDLFFGLICKQIKRKKKFTLRDREKKLKIFIFFNFFHLISFRLIGSVAQFYIHISHTHTHHPPHLGGNARLLLRNIVNFSLSCIFVAQKRQRRMNEPTKQRVHHPLYHMIQEGSLKLCMFVHGFVSQLENRKSSCCQRRKKA